MVSGNRRGSGGAGSSGAAALSNSSADGAGRSSGASAPCTKGREVVRTHAAPMPEKGPGPTQQGRVRPESRANQSQRARQLVGRAWPHFGRRRPLRSRQGVQVRTHPARATCPSGWRRAVFAPERGKQQARPNGVVSRQGTARTLSSARKRRARKLLARGTRQAASRRSKDSQNASRMEKTVGCSTGSAVRGGSP